MYFNFISEIQSLNCQLIVLAGNHDSVSMLAESKSLLRTLSTKVIANVSDTTNTSNLAEQVFVLKNKQDEPQAVICAVPFIRPRDVIKSKAGQSASDKSTSLHQAIVEHYLVLFNHAQQLVKDSKLALPIIATGHLTALGATISDSVRDIYIGTLEALPSSAFPAADYIALGHIHRAQKVGKTEHIRYSGSPIALSFDEAKQNKRVLMVEFEQSQLASITDLIVPCFQPLAMVKTSLAKLSKAVEELLSEPTFMKISADDKLKLWLDIELSDRDHLSDLQTRIVTLMDDFPVEVLLIRRAKQVRKALLDSQQDNSTLSELTIEDVFSSRLAQEACFNQTDATATEIEQAQADKKRLQTLFKKTLEQILTREGGL